MTVSDLFGQRGERAIGMTGWISPDPWGEEISHLMIYPTGDDIAAEMRALAGVLGLGAATARTGITAPESTHVTVDGEPVVRVYPGSEVLHIPVSGEWAAIARDRGQIVLSVGERIWRGHRDPARRAAALDRYTARAEQLHLGLVPVRAL